MKDQATKILIEDLTEASTIIDITGIESITASFNHVEDTEFSAAVSDNADMSLPEQVPSDFLIDAAEASEVVTGAGQEDTAGSLTDTTVYPVLSQTGKKIITTIDASESPITTTFTNAIDRGYIASAGAVVWPLDIGAGEIITLTKNGGGDEIVTFASEVLGATPSDVVDEINTDEGVDYTAVVIEAAGVETGFYVMPNTGGAAAAITATTDITGLTFDAPDVRNTVAGIVSEVEADISAVGEATVVGGQMKITSDTTGAASSVAVVQGSPVSTLSFGTAVAGFGQTWDYLKYSATGKGRVAMVFSGRRYLRFYLSGTKAVSDDLKVIKGWPHLAPIS